MKSKLHPEKQRKEVRHLTQADLQKKPQGEKIRSNKNCCCPYHVIISRSSSKVPYPPGKAIIASA